MPFINMAGLGKQAKQAHGVDKLKVGATEEHSIIATPHCAFAIVEQHEPNKMKAIITEYLGYLPVPDPTTTSGGFVEVGNSTGTRDLEAAETINVHKMIYNKSRKQPFVQTPVIVAERGIPVRIIQDTKTNKCYGIRQEYLDLITYKDLNYDIEGDPVGPEVDEHSKLAYFTNATTILVLALHLFTTDKAREIVDLLQLIELREEKR